MSCLYRSTFGLLIFAALIPVRVAALDPATPLDSYERQGWQAGGGLPQNTVNSIVQTRDAYLWIATDGGLVRFDGYQFTLFTAENTPALPSNQIRSVAEDASGNLLVVSAGGRAIRTSSGWEGAWARGPNLPTDYGATRSSHGLVERSGEGTHIYTTADGLPSNHVTTLYRDGQGTLWIGTEGGLARLRNGKIDRFAPADVFSNDVILAVTEDRDGDLWIGTDANGLFVLRDREFTAYSSRGQALDRAVWSVLGGPDGTVWLGTDGNGIVRVEHGVVSRPAFNSQLASQTVLSLAWDTEGHLLAGTPDGLNRIQGDHVGTITSADGGLAEDFVRSLYTDLDGSLWVGTRRGLTHLQRGVLPTSSVTYTQADGLPSDFVGSVVRDGKGDLWAGTLNGLSRFRNGAFRTYTTRDGLSSNVITDLYVDKRGRLWIGTQGGGLDAFQNEHFERFTPASGVPETVYGIAEDDLGDLWLAAKTSIVRIRRSALEAYKGQGSLPVISYGASDGLRVTSCSGGGHPGVARTSAGDIWFAMSRGAASIAADHTRTSLLPPSVVIESVLVDEHPIDPARVSRLPASVSHIAFEYAGISLKAPQKVHYRYKLGGFDADWQDAGSQRTAYYTNLPPGDYQFQVTAQNGDAVWNRLATSVVFTQTPHAYQTWWFRLLLLAGAAFVTYAIYLLRVRQMQAEYNAVLRERNRIAREIHDTLAQGFIGVSVQLEVVARLLNRSPEAAREQLNETRMLVRRSIADARASIWELRSQEAENQDFAARLTNMAKHATAASSVRLQMEVRGEYRPLQPAVEDELFRICQEAVTNAVRHAGASRIGIDLAFDARKLRMTVSDDGCGFAGEVNSSGPDGHFGLKGMRERAQRIAATIAVDSTLGKGTTVIVEAPAK